MVLLWLQSPYGLAALEKEGASMNTFSGKWTRCFFFFVLILFITRASFAESWESEILTGVSADLTSIWATSSITAGTWPNNVKTEIFCTGETGTIIYHNGTAWQSQDSGTPNTLNGVWGSSGNDVIAVGLSGTIRHYNGAAWTSESYPTANTLNAVWGISGNDVFAVGDYGTILHYNGSSWQPQDSGTNSNLNAVWGSSANDVFVVGELFTILHYDGYAWSAFEPTFTERPSLNGIWGYAADSVFAVGESGTIIWYNGDVWALMSSEISSSIILNAVWGASACNVYAVGRLSNNGAVYHFDGSTWSSQENLLSPANPAALLGIHGTSLRDIFVVGNVGTFVSYNLPEEEKYPLVCATSPVDGTTDVAINANLIASFSTEMDPDTITEATFTLTDTKSPVPGTVSYESGAFAVFTPDDNLESETTYTATLGRDIEDRFGYGIGDATDYTWSFTTTAEPSSISASGGCFISAALGRN